MGKTVAVPLILMLYNYLCKTLHFRRKDFARDSSSDCQQNINDSMILHFYRTITI